MFPSWERRAAEGLKNAEHMRELRNKIDLQHQEQLRRREREREDVEMKRRAQRMILMPLLTSPRKSKFKSHSYGRPWTVGKPASKKTSPTSVKRSRADAKRSSVERLPDLVSGAQSRPSEQKASKTSRRAQSNSSVRFKEQGSPCPQPAAVSPTTKHSKHVPITTRRIQGRKSDTTATHVPHGTLRDAGIQRIDSSFNPQPLTTPDHSLIDWTSFPSVENISPCPDREPTPELQYPFQSLWDISSISEESLNTTEDSRTTPTSSEDSFLQEFLPFHWSSTSSELESISPSVGSSAVEPVEDLTLESEREDEDEERFRPWHDLRSESNPLAMSRSSPAYLRSPLSTPRMIPPRSSSESTRQGYATRLTAELAGPSTAPSGISLSRGGTSNGHAYCHLPALDSPRRPPPSSLNEERMENNSLDTALEDEEGAHGGRTLPSLRPLPRTIGLRHDLNLAMMAFHELRLEVTQSDRESLHSTGDSGSPENKRSASPETLRRITARLLEEESDEENEDMCRICQCKGASPINPLLCPCQCSGSLQYIHHDCLRRWVQAKIKSGTELTAVKTCELCKGSLTLDMDDFDVVQGSHSAPSRIAVAPQFKYDI
ncbi:E3 ubiquitin-protein ligase MARCHF7-like isoform X2 [Hoplias malabaricus]|uniref:E3 ubiquitin-protein ligase MARCHF7-like isoform X2 n=1 Tax=Hoplias malabaricus TaxID=27720 RepID=UPI0034638344